MCRVTELTSAWYLYNRTQDGVSNSLAGVEQTFTVHVGRLVDGVLTGAWQVSRGLRKTLTSVEQTICASSSVVFLLVNAQLAQAAARAARTVQSSTKMITVAQHASHGSVHQKQHDQFRFRANATGVREKRPAHKAPLHLH